MTTLRPLPHLVLLWLAMGFHPPAAAFDEPVLRLDAEMGYAGYAEERRYHGMFAGLDAAFTFDDFWGVRAGYGLGVHRGKSRAFEVHQLAVGARYQLDVFHYVPWIDLSPALYLTSGEGGPGGDPQLGVAAGVGLDRLFDERWSLGVGARYHQLFGQERFPSYLTVMVRVGHRWTFGDPFAP